MTPWSIAGADGWTLTDWFENVYLSQAGPEMYDQLTNHEIPWTDPSVEEALNTLATEGWRPMLISPELESLLSVTTRSTHSLTLMDAGFT